jgi:hypothetical protein
VVKLLLLFGFAVPEGTPYRNPVEVNKIQGCIIKALQIQQEVCPEPDPQLELQPRMWIITPTLAAHKLEVFGAIADQARWGKGIYLLSKGLQTGIIVVHQLPETPETLLFRLMGKGKVQQTAMAEVAALPIEAPYRQSLLDLLVSYRMELAAKQDAEPEEQKFRCSQTQGFTSGHFLSFSPCSIDRVSFTMIGGL